MFPWRQGPGAESGGAVGSWRYQFAPAALGRGERQVHSLQMWAGKKAKRAPMCVPSYPQGHCRARGQPWQATRAFVFESLLHSPGVQGQELPEPSLECTQRAQGKIIPPHKHRRGCTGVSGSGQLAAVAGSKQEHVKEGRRGTVAQGPAFVQSPDRKEIRH